MRLEKPPLRTWFVAVLFASLCGCVGERKREDPITVGLFNLSGKQPLPGVDIYAPNRQGARTRVGRTDARGKIELQPGHGFDLTKLEFELKRFKRVDEKPNTDEIRWKVDHPIYVRLDPDAE